VQQYYSKVDVIPGGMIPGVSHPVQPSVYFDQLAQLLASKESKVQHIDQSVSNNASLAAPSSNISVAATEKTPRGAIAEQSAYNLPGAPALQKAAAASFADQHTTFESLSCSDGDETANSSSESISVQLETSMQQIDESGVESPALAISLSDSTSAGESATAIQQPTSKEEEEIKEESIEEEPFNKNNIVLCVRVESIRRLVKIFNGRECCSDLAPLSQPSDEGRMHIFVSCVRYVILSFFATLLFLVQGLPFGFVREGIGTRMVGKHAELYCYF
jgi:hypothetical protein